MEEQRKQTLFGIPSSTQAAYRGLHEYLLQQDARLQQREQERAAREAERQRAAEARATVQEARDTARSTAQSQLETQRQEGRQALQTQQALNRQDIEALRIQARQDQQLHAEALRQATIETPEERANRLASQALAERQANEAAGLVVPPRLTTTQDIQQQHTVVEQQRQDQAQQAAQTERQRQDEAARATQRAQLLQGEQATQAQTQAIQARRLAIERAQLTQTPQSPQQYVTIGNETRLLPPSASVPPPPREARPPGRAPEAPGGTIPLGEGVVSNRAPETPPGTLPSTALTTTAIGRARDLQAQADEARRQEEDRSRIAGVDLNQVRITEQQRVQGAQAERARGQLAQALGIGTAPFPTPTTQPPPGTTFQGQPVVSNLVTPTALERETLIQPQVEAQRQQEGLRAFQQGVQTVARTRALEAQTSLARPVTLPSGQVVQPSSTATGLQAELERQRQEQAPRIEALTQRAQENAIRNQIRAESTALYPRQPGAGDTVYPAPVLNFLNTVPQQFRTPQLEQSALQEFQTTGKITPLRGFKIPISQTQFAAEVEKPLQIASQQTKPSTATTLTTAQQYPTLNLSAGTVSRLGLNARQLEAVAALPQSEQALIEGGNPASSQSRVNRAVEELASRQQVQTLEAQLSQGVPEATARRAAEQARQNVLTGATQAQAREAVVGEQARLEATVPTKIPELRAEVSTRESIAAAQAGLAGGLPQLRAQTEVAQQVANIQAGHEANLPLLQQQQQEAINRAKIGAKVPASEAALQLAQLQAQTEAGVQRAKVASRALTQQVAIEAGLTPTDTEKLIQSVEKLTVGRVSAYEALIQAGDLLSPENRTLQRAIGNVLTQELSRQTGTTGVSILGVPLPAYGAISSYFGAPPAITLTPGQIANVQRLLGVPTQTVGAPPVSTGVSQPSLNVSRTSVQVVAPSGERTDVPLNLQAGEEVRSATQTQVTTSTGRTINIPQVEATPGAQARLLAYNAEGVIQQPVPPPPKESFQESVTQRQIAGIAEAAVQPGAVTQAYNLGKPASATNLQDVTSSFYEQHPELLPQPTTTPEQRLRSLEGVGTGPLLSEDVSRLVGKIPSIQFQREATQLHTGEVLSSERVAATSDITPYLTASGVARRLVGTGYEVEAALAQVPGAIHLPTTAPKTPRETVAANILSTVRAGENPLPTAEQISQAGEALQTESVASAFGTSVPTARRIEAVGSLALDVAPFAYLGIQALRGAGYFGGPPPGPGGLPPSIGGLPPRPPTGGRPGIPPGEAHPGTFGSLLQDLTGQFASQPPREAAVQSAVDTAIQRGLFEEGSVLTPGAPTSARISTQSSLPSLLTEERGSLGGPITPPTPLTPPPSRLAQVPPSQSFTFAPRATTLTETPTEQPGLVQQALQGIGNFLQSGPTVSEAFSAVVNPIRNLVSKIPGIGNIFPVTKGKIDAIRAATVREGGNADLGELSYLNNVEKNIINTVQGEPLSGIAADQLATIRARQAELRDKLVPEGTAFSPLERLSTRYQGAYPPKPSTPGSASLTRTQPTPSTPLGEVSPDLQIQSAYSDQTVTLNAIDAEITRLNHVSEGLTPNAPQYEAFQSQIDALNQRANRVIQSTRTIVEPHFQSSQVSPQTLQNEIQSIALDRAIREHPDFNEAIKTGPISGRQEIIQKLTQDHPLEPTVTFRDRTLGYVTVPKSVIGEDVTAVPPVSTTLTTGLTPSEQQALDLSVSVLSSAPYSRTIQGTGPLLPRVPGVAFSTPAPVFTAGRPRTPAQIQEILRQSLPPEEPPPVASGTPPTTTTPVSGAGGSAASVPSPLTAEADRLLARIDAGGRPTQLTSNLRRIARENGIYVAPTDLSPDSLIEQLRQRRVTVTQQASSVKPAAGTIVEGVEAGMNKIPFSEQPVLSEARRAEIQASQDAARSFVGTGDPSTDASTLIARTHQLTETGASPRLRTTQGDIQYVTDLLDTPEVQQNPALEQALSDQRATLRSREGPPEPRAQFPIPSRTLTRGRGTNEQLTRWYDLQDQLRQAAPESPEALQAQQELQALTEQPSILRSVGQLGVQAVRDLLNTLTQSSGGGTTLSAETPLKPRNIVLASQLQSARRTFGGPLNQPLEVTPLSLVEAPPLQQSSSLQLPSNFASLTGEASDAALARALEQSPGPVSRTLTQPTPPSPLSSSIVPREFGEQEVTLRAPGGRHFTVRFFKEPSDPSKVYIASLSSTRGEGTGQLADVTPELFQILRNQGAQDVTYIPSTEGGPLTEASRVRFFEGLRRQFIEGATRETSQGLGGDVPPTLAPGGVQYPPSPFESTQGARETARRALRPQDYPFEQSSDAVLRTEFDQLTEQLNSATTPDPALIERQRQAAEELVYRRQPGPPTLLQQVIAPLRREGGFIRFPKKPDQGEPFQGGFAERYTQARQQNAPIPSSQEATDLSQASTSDLLSRSQDLSRQLASLEAEQNTLQQNPSASAYQDTQRITALNEQHQSILRDKDVLDNEIHQRRLRNYPSSGQVSQPTETPVQEFPLVSSGQEQRIQAVQREYDVLAQSIARERNSVLDNIPSPTGIFDRNYAAEAALSQFQSDHASDIQRFHELGAELRRLTGESGQGSVLGLAPLVGVSVLAGGALLATARRAAGSVPPPREDALTPVSRETISFPPSAQEQQDRQRAHLIFQRLQFGTPNLPELNKTPPSLLEDRIYNFMQQFRQHRQQRQQR